MILKTVATMPGIKVENGATEEAYPELFDTRAMLPQPKEKKPGQLPDELIRKYFEEVSFHFDYYYYFVVKCS